MSEAPSPFSPTLPTFQTHWDSTSLGWFKTCPRLYQYFMLEGWSPRSRGMHLVFGGLYAAALERYAHARASGSSHDDATVAMVRWALEASGERVFGVFISWETGDPIKNRHTLIRSLIWNVEDKLTSPFQTHIMHNGKPAVELSFHFEAFEVAGEPIYLAGHLDEVVVANGDLWIRDDKTTKGSLGASYFSRYSPDNQMSLYSIAGKVILNEPVRGVLVKAAQIGVNFTRFQTQQIPRPQGVLTEWLSETATWIALAHHFAMLGEWPRNDKSCDKFGGCVFQKVCSVSPSHRRAWLEEDFEKRTWNPLEARGDIT